MTTGVNVPPLNVFNITDYKAIMGTPLRTVAPALLKTSSPTILHSSLLTNNINLA